MTTRERMGAVDTALDIYHQWGDRIPMSLHLGADDDMIIHVRGDRALIVTGGDGRVTLVQEKDIDLATLEGWLESLTHD